MTGLLIAFVITLLLPLFVGTWRTSLLGLAVQGALMASIAFRQHGGHLSLELGLSMFDLVVLRAIGLPLALYLVLRAQGVPARNDVIAPNLFSWAMAIALVVVAFRTTDVLVPKEGDEQWLVAAASSALLLGLFVLSTARGTVSQVIGLMRIENAIALFELGSGPDHEPLAIRLGQTLVLLVSIGFYRWYVIGLAREESSPGAAETSAL
jgi:hydrogenase-4 membrane subunit HyfE